MTCDEVRDLVPACALGAATDEEVRLVEQHIETCREHDAEIEEAGSTAELVSHGIPAMEPPEGLRARILEAALERDAGHAGVSPTERRGVGVGARTQSDGLMRWLKRASLRAHPMAAVFVLLIGGLIAWNVMLQTQAQPERFTHYYWGNDADWMQVETVLGEPGADVSLGGMSRLDGARRYHLWTTRENDTLLVGAFNVNPEGRWAGEFDFTFQQNDRLWVTVEDATGATEPTGEAIMRTRFGN